MQGMHISLNIAVMEIRKFFAGLNLEPNSLHHHGTWGEIKKIKVHQETLPFLSPSYIAPALLHPTLPKEPTWHPTPSFPTYLVDLVWLLLVPLEAVVLVLSLKFKGASPT